jgi:TolA-binding protein
MQSEARQKTRMLYELDQCSKDEQTMLVQGLEQQIDKLNREISKIQDKTEQRR